MALNETTPRRRRTRIWLVGILLLGISAALAAGCSTLSYYAQTIQGHFAVQEAARPIPDVIADPASTPALKEQLSRARTIRSYASSELALPDNGSYTRYADLKRPFVVWNVFAAPELSLQLKKWCYPVVGCAEYRGYFDRSSAEAAAGELRAEGYEVNIVGVPAYSTLGWFDDPLLNTFIGGSEGQLAGLIFHELAHQVVFVGGDTTFNESFATAVEREGVRRWLRDSGNDEARKAYAEFDLRRAQFLDLLLRYRALLQQNYDSTATVEQKRERKQQLFAELRRDYAQLKTEWGGYSGYDRFFALDLTNAHLASVAAYNDLVPAFDAVLAGSGGQFPAFYTEVKRLASLPKNERDAVLNKGAPR